MQMQKVKLIHDQKKNKLSFIEKDSFIINNQIKKKIKSKIIKLTYDKVNYFKKIETIIC